MLLNDDEDFRVVLTDCIPHLHTMPEASVDMSVFSPPFPSVFAYTDAEALTSAIRKIWAERRSFTFRRSFTASAA